MNWLMENVKDSEHTTLREAFNKALESLDEEIAKIMISQSKFEWIHSTLVPNIDEINEIEEM